MNADEVKKTVRESYGAIARGSGSCCGPSASSCCGESVSAKIGYDNADLAGLPDGSDLGLGCGNPSAFASLRKGETVLDLGSGPGMDCFIAARTIGPTGHVIGVDMTPEMIARARANAEKGGYRNVEFRLGEIENLPAADASVDAVLSNCVINLAPDKARVFREAFRVLRPGGRLMVSDIVLARPLPAWLLASKAAWSSCVSGAELRDRYLADIGDAGFEDIAVVKEIPFAADLIAFAKDHGIVEGSPANLDEIEGAVVSVTVSARKPV